MWRWGGYIVKTPALQRVFVAYLQIKRLCITKTCRFNADPLKPQFYIVQLGSQGYTLFFLFLLKNIDCGYSLEPPRRGGCNEYPQSIFLSRNMANIRFFLSEIFQFLVVKFPKYLNRRVFEMVLTFFLFLHRNM